MVTEAVLGGLGVLGAIIAFGSYAVFIKLPSVMEADIDPVVFQTYKSFACFATSWLVLIYAPLRFTWWGMVGAGLWMITGVGAISAVRLAGIGPTQSLWSGLSIFVSYVWGAYIFQEPIQNQPLSLVGLFVMAVGMCGVGWASSGKVSVLGQLQKMWKAAGRRSKRAHRISQLCVEEHLSRDLIFKEEGESISLEQKFEAPEAYNDPDARFVWGVICAAIVGITNGSFMLPLQYANKPTS